MTTAERGVDVDYSSINRWAITSSPLVEEVLHRRKRLVWVRWWVDKHGQTIDFLFTKHRDKEAAWRLLGAGPMKRPSKALTKRAGPPS